MNNETRTSEVLNRTADLIEEQGWGKGGGWYGEEDFGGRTDGRLCLEGGIMAAMGIEMTNMDRMVACPAYKSVKTYLDGATPFIWNDEHGRTASEVIEVLRAAAVIEAAREESHDAEMNPASRQPSAAPRQRIIPGPVVPAPVEDETSVSA